MFSYPIQTPSIPERDAGSTSTASHVLEAGRAPSPAHSQRGAQGSQPRPMHHAAEPELPRTKPRLPGACSPPATGSPSQSSRLLPEGAGGLPHGFGVPHWSPPPVRTHQPWTCNSP